MKRYRYRYIFLCLLVFTFFLCACGEKHTYIFTGESDKFIAELTVKATIKDSNKAEDNETKTIFKVTYKGNINELNNYNYLTISYKSNASGIDETFDLKNESFSKTFSRQIGGKGVAVENKDDTINAIIKLDDEIIEISMKSK